MTKKKTLLVAVAATLLGVLTPQRGAAQWIVNDPINTIQGTISAIQNVQQTINQATQIANEVAQINNQIQQINQGARNLASIPTNLSQSYIMSFGRLMQSLENVQGLMSTVDTMQRRFASKYPDFASSNPSFQQAQHYSDDWHKQNQQNVSDALESGATVLQNLRDSQADLLSAQNSSTAAVGQLQAVQAGNQINAVVASQLQQMQAQNAVFQQAVLEKQASDEAREQLAEKQAKKAMSNWSEKGAHAPVVDPLLQNSIGH